MSAKSLALFWLAVLLAAAAYLLAPHPAPEPWGPIARTTGPNSAYVGSGACRSCHAQAYDSWHRSFHRSMTRQVSELAWDGTTSPRLPATLDGVDGRYVLSRSPAGRLVVRGPDLHAPLPSREVVQRELALVTGSHHYLAFWVTGPSGRELRQLPFVFTLDERAWVPRSESFLAPPSATRRAPAWNSNCIQCHAVAGEPRQSEGVEPGPWVLYETRAAELGIACEACHGPGRAHTDKLRTPWARQAAHENFADGAPEPSAMRAEFELSIVNPARLSAEASSQVCGQCHAYFLPRLPEEWWINGYTQRAAPAVNYADSRSLLRATAPAQAEEAQLSHELDSIFWGDGSVRVAGREYNGLLESPCFSRGHGAQKMSCLSCHSMHQSDPNDQLRRAVDGRALEQDALCTSCHAQLSGKAAEHSGHAADSSGSACVNCHMPKTSYALLQGIRSHRISSPSPRSTDAPSACVLCHQDKSQEWLDSAFARLFPGAAPPPGERHPPGSADGPQLGHDPRIPVGVGLLLAGDAAERALLASALGEPGARSLLDPTFSIRLLEALGDDPYPAVRRISRRVRAQLTEPGPQGSGRPELPEGWLDALRETRDDRPVVISE